MVVRRPLVIVDGQIRALAPGVEIDENILPLIIEHGEIRQPQPGYSLVALRPLVVIDGQVQRLPFNDTLIYLPTGIVMASLTQTFTFCGEGEGMENGWGVPEDIGLTASNVELRGVSNSRKGFVMCNLSNPGIVYVNLGAAASLSSALYVLQPGQTLMLSGSECQGSINAVAVGSDVSITIREEL